CSSVAKKCFRLRLRGEQFLIRDWEGTGAAYEQIADAWAAKVAAGGGCVRSVLRIGGVRLAAGIDAGGFGEGSESNPR
ncbi:MAG TPA: hypothetical protein VIL86_16445, partial [Tepidisphaeraceae bacterium]